MLKKVDPAIKRETCYIACFVLLLSILMQAVYLILGAWHIGVLLGNLLGAFAAILNFFLMGLGIQKALGLSEKDAKDRMKASHSLRMLMLVICCVIGAAVPVFDLIAVVVPLIFPRIAVSVRPLLDKKNK